MTTIKMYKCPYCGVKDLTEEEINQHIASSHPMQHGFEHRLPKVVNITKTSKWGDDAPPRRYYERRRQW